MSIEQERQKFEAFMSEKNPTHDLEHEFGIYRHSPVQRHWETWLAAIELYQRRIEELESQLEAVGAGGVSSQRITSPSRGEPVAWRYLTPTGWHATTDAARALAVAEHHTVEPLYAAPQPAEPVELDRYDAGLLGGQDGMPAYVWHDIIRAELDRAYDFYMDQLDRATPQPAESHVDRANRIVDSWPEWKRNYALTKHDVKPTQPAAPEQVPSDDERAAQGLPPYSPRHMTEEEWNRLTENGRRAWGKQPAVPEKEPPCDT